MFALAIGFFGFVAPALFGPSARGTVYGRPDPGGHRALHRHGAGVEPTGQGQQRVRRRPGRAEQRLPDPHCSASTPGCSSRCCRRCSDCKAWPSSGDHRRDLRQRHDLSRHSVRGRHREPRRPRAAEGCRLVHREFVPRISPITLVALLFTIVVMFSIQGERIVPPAPGRAVDRHSALIYFAIMFLVSFFMAWKSRGGLPAPRRWPSPRRATTSSWRSRWRSRCSASRSAVAFATVVGPLVEVPVLIGLVHVSSLVPAKRYPESTGLRP